MAGLGLAMLDRVFDQIGHVLMKRALARDVQHLRASAYAEDGHAPAVGAPAQLHLEPVDDRIGGTELRVWLGSVAGRVQVGTSREQQPRQMIQDRIDVLHLQGRQGDRQTAGHLDGAHVGEPERHLGLRGLSVQHVLDVVLVTDLRDGDADHGHAALMPAPTCPCCHRSGMS